MAVKFDGDKLVINMKPDFFDEEIEKLDKRMTSHLDWVAQSLRRIRMTVESDFVSLGSVLIQTPSKKATSKKNKAFNSGIPTNVHSKIVPNDVEPKIKQEIVDEDHMELITFEESEPEDKNKNEPIKSSQLLTDDESLSNCVTPPKSEIRIILKRSSRVIQSAQSAAKVVEPSKRIKGSEFRTPSFSSSRITRSKTRIQSSPSTCSSLAKGGSGRESKTDPSVVMIKKGATLSKSSESIRGTSVESCKSASQTSSTKVRKILRNFSTPNNKLNAPKPKITESAQKRLQIEEERRLQLLREKLEREQRAKEKKMDYLNRKVMEQKSKREEREKKVALTKKKNEEKKLELEKKKMEKEELKHKDFQLKKSKAKPWSSTESVAKENRIQILTKKQEAIDQKTKSDTVKNGDAKETNTLENKTAVLTSSNKDNLNNKGNFLNSTYKAKEMMPPQNVEEQSTYVNYNIDDLKSEDDTDDERKPKKEIPMWARGNTFITLLNKQFCKPLVNREHEIKKLFHTFNEEVVLEKIFQGSCPVSSRYEKRTSSACWSSPPANHINHSFSKHLNK